MIPRNLKDVVREVVLESPSDTSTVDVALEALDRAVGEGILDATSDNLDLAMMQAQQYAEQVAS